MGCRLETVSAQLWHREASQFRDYSYMHYWAYSQFAAERLGAVSENVAVYNGSDRLIALANVRIKNMPFGFGGIAYISGGPIIDKEQETLESDLERVLASLRGEFVDKRGLVLRVSQRHKIMSKCLTEAGIYQRAGFTECGSTNATMLVDLEPELPVIRQRFHQKWRNVLNKSERQNLEIVSGGELKLYDDFACLFEDLISRKSFDVDMDEAFYATVQKHAQEQEKLHMAIAFSDGQPVGGHLSSISGDTSVYLLGATNDVGRKTGAAYLLQWHAITESKQAGCRWYDLGGVDKEKNPHVYLFKQRMGGIETEIERVFQLSDGLIGRATLAAERVYRRLKGK